MPNLVSSPLRTRLSCLVPSLIAAAWLYLGAAGAGAQTTLHVDTLSDTTHSTNDCSTGSGTSCSLRDAMNQGNVYPSGDTIVFNSGLSGTITLGSELPATGQSMTITGPGANLITISGAGRYAILEVNAGPFTISGLTLANANSRNGAMAASDNYYGITVSQCIFLNNTSTFTDSGGGAIEATGPVTVIDSTFIGNYATASQSDGGAIEGTAGTNLTVINSTFVGNHAYRGGAISFYEGTLKVINSTFSGNVSTYEGGAMWTIEAAATLNNNIFLGNTVSSAGGGGGVYNLEPNSTSINSNVYWNNLAGGSEDDCESCSGSGNTSASSNPLTLPLGYYGGTTQTFLPLPGSAAIAAGCSSLAVDGNNNALTSDQRGFALTAGSATTNCSAGTVDAGAVQTNFLTVQSNGGGLSTNGAADCPGTSCTLADAVAVGNSTGSDIIFASNVNSIAQSGGLTLNSAYGVNIIGPGPGGVTVNGGNNGSVFKVASGTSSLLYGLTITGGYASEGAGVFNYGTLTLAESTVTANAMSLTAFGVGGGVFNNPNSTMTILNSTISSNFATGYGGGIGNYGTMTIQDSTVGGSNESEEYGGGVYNDGTMSILDSTISQNSADYSGGGVYNDLSSTLSIYGSTIAGNNAQGSDVTGGGIYSAGTLSLNQCTISNNYAGGTAASGFGGLGFNTGSAVTLANTIVAGNHTNEYYADTEPGYNDIGGNLVGTNSALYSTVNPNLSQLQYNGSAAAIQTMIPLPGSQAICASLASNIPSGTTTDERGFPLQPTNGYCTSTQVDAGAVQTNYTSAAFIQQPSDVAMNTDMTTPAVVQVLETNTLSNTSNGVNGIPVTLTLANGNNYLSGNTEITATATNGSSSVPGEATFSNLQVSQPEVNDTLSMTAITVVGSMQLGPITSDEFNVSGPAVQLVVTAPSPSTAGSPFSVTVTAKDSNGNTARGYTGKVHFITSDSNGGIVLPADYTFVTGDYGAHTFPGGVTLITSGSQTVTATDTSNGSITGIGTVTINAAGPTAISVSAGSGQSAVVTQAFSVALAAKVTDTYGNSVPGVVVTYTAPSTGASGTFASGGNTIAGLTSANGNVSETFTANANTGSYSVMAQAAGVSTPATFSLTNNLASTVTAASSVSVPSSSLSQNVTLSATVSVSGAGPSPVNQGSVTFAVTGIGSISGSVSNGTATASLTIPGSTPPGNYSITATYNGGLEYSGSSDSTQSVVVNSSNTAIAAANAVVTTSASDQAVQLNASVISTQGPVNGGIVSFSVSGSGGQIGNVVTSGTVVNGIASASFTVPGGTAPGTYSITANYSGSGLFGASSDNFHTLTVYQAPTQLVFGTAPAASVAAGGNAGSAITVEEMSSGNVLVASASDTITLTVAYPDGSSQVYTQSAVNGVATFDLSAVTLTEGGDYTYTASFTGLTSAVAYEEVTGSAYADPATNVGSQSSTQTVVVQLASSFTLGSIDVLTQGAIGLDFQLAADNDGTACIIGADYSAGQSCTVNYTFNPTAPGARNGAIVLYDNATPMANAVATVYLQGTGRGPQAVFSPSTISTLGGGYPFSGSEELALDGSGNVYVTEDGVSTIMVIPAGCASTSCVTRMGGGFSNIEGVAVDGAGNLYVGDYFNREVRKIPAGCTATAYNSNQCTVTTLMSGFTDPGSVAVDGKGNLYVGDWNYNQNRGNVDEIPVGCTSQSCMVTLGGGFTEPKVGGVDGSGNVYLGDLGSVKEIPAGCSNSSCVISLGGAFNNVFGVAIDGSGDVYVTEFSSNKVSMIPAGCTTANLNSSLCTVTTLGSGFSAPWGVGTDSAGNVYVNNSGNGVVKEINRAAVAPPSNVTTLSFASTLAGSTSSDSPQTVTVQNIGNANLSFTAVTFAADFPEGSGASDCTTATPLAPATGCTLTIDFSPLAANVTGPAMNETVSLQDNTLNQVNVQQNVAVAGTIKPTLLVFATPPAANIGTGGNAGAAIAVNEILTGSVVDSADSTDTITLTVTYPDGTTQAYTQTEASGVAIFNLSAVTLTEAGDYTYTATTNAAGVTSVAADEQVTGSTYTAPTTSIGTQSDVQTAVVPITSNFTLGNASVVTQGVTSLDFQIAAASGGSACTVGQAYTAGQSCTVNYTFKPTAPGARYGAIVLNDNITGDPAAASVLLEADGVGPEVAISPFAFGTVGPLGYFTGLGGIAVDAGGNVYVADQGNSVVQQIQPGVLMTPVGSNAGAQFGKPQAVALDGAGNVYFTDGQNQRVGEVQQGACSSANCETWLGGGNFQQLGAIAVDSSGSVYVADSAGVQKMTPGCATSSCVATLNGGFGANVSDLKVDGSGNLYVADGSVNAVKMMPAACNSPSCVILLGNGGVQPVFLAVDGPGNVYEIESGPNDVLKEIPAGCATSACVITIVGSGIGSAGEIAVDDSGNVYVTNTGLIQTIQRGAVAPPSNVATLYFAPTPEGSTSSDSPQQVTLRNIGNAPLSIIGSVSYTTDFPEASGASDCNSSTPVPAGGTCALSIDFSPHLPVIFADSMVLLETVSVSDNNRNASSATQQISVSGTVFLPPTQFMVSVPGSAAAGSAFSVTVTAQDQLGERATYYTGTVHFTSTDNGAGRVLPPDYTFTSGDFGSHTFTNLASLVTAGNQTITATDIASSVTGVSSAIAVSGLSTPTQIIVSGFPATPYIGVPATGTVVVADQYGNAVLGYSGSATVTISDTSGTVTSPVTITNGTGTFTATFQTQGAQSITASIAGSGLTSVPDSVTVSPIPIYVVARTDDDASGPAAGNCVNQNTGQSSTGGTDNSQCTLRDAVTAADAATAGTITFDPTVFATQQTIRPTSVIHSDTANSVAYLTINGPASGVTLGGGFVPAGGGLLSFGAGRVVSISGLTLQGAPGAALNIQNANVTVSNCTFSGNAGAIYSTNGTVTVSGSTFNQNSASYGGAAYLSGGSLSIEQSTLSNNTASNKGGGVFMTGSNPTLSITNSTLIGNLSNGGGGAGVWVDSGTANIKYSTFSGNTANGQGGAINSSGTVTLTNVTVYENSSYPNPGGGIVNNGGTFTLGNSIVAWNTGASSSENDAVGTFTSLGHNLISDGSGSTGFIGSDQVGAAGGSINPLLSPLGNYGGPTRTMMPLPGSPAIAAGDISLIGTSNTDQRGQPASVGGAVDIGAVESQGFTMSVSGGSPQSTTVGQYFALPLSVLVTANNPAEPVSGGLVSFSVPSGATASLDSPIGIIGSNGLASDSAQANLTAGSYDVSATVGGSSVQFALTNSPGRPSQLNLVSGNNQSATVNTAFASPLVVSVMDAYGNLVPGTSITFTSLTGGAGASAIFSNGTNTITGTSDSSGQLSESITANTIADFLYYVQVSGGGAPVDFSLTNTAGSAALITATSGSGQSVAAGAQFANPLVATVTDLYGNPIPNVLVTFTAPGTGASGTFAVNGTNTASYTTDVIGQRSLGFIANVTPGSYTVTAAAAGISTPASFSLTNNQPPTFVVNTNQDDDGSSPGNCPPNPTTTGGGNCTLRDALAAVNGAASVNITFDASVFKPTNSAADNTIKLTNGVLTIPSNITITGAYSGSGDTLKDVVTVSGEGQSGVFQISASTANVSITGLAITNALVSDPSTGSRQTGGGLFNNGYLGSLIIAHSIFSNNTISSPAAGGAAWGGAIFSNTDVALNDCVFSGNKANAGNDAEGAAIFGVGAISATNIVVTGNISTADPSVGGVEGGAISAQATVAITGSTFINNQASAYQAEGGALYVYQSGTLTYSTFSGNSAKGHFAFGGALLLFDGFTADNDTFSGNTSSDIAGGIVFESNYGGTLVLSNSVITANSANNGAPGYIGGVYSYGAITAANNFIGGNPGGDCGYYGCPNNGDNGNMVGVGNANLAPLGNYGGPMQTMVPLPGSPLICAGALANVTSGIITDERGYPIQPSGGYCPSGTVDMGAVQTNYTSVAFVRQPTDAFAGVNMSPAPTVGVLETNTLLNSNNTDAVGGIPISVTPSGGTYAGSPFNVVTGKTSPFLATLSGLNSRTAASGISLGTSSIPVTGSYSLPAVTSNTYNVLGPASVLTSPAPNSVLAGPQVTFSWTIATSATNYIFRLGTTGPGSNDLFGSGPITTTSVTRTNLPTNGEIIYARLYTQHGSTVVYTDYTFTAASQAVLTSPSPNTTLAGPEVTFNWTAASGATSYIFRLGTTRGGYDLYGSGPVTTTSVTRTNLPINGETIFARLYTYYGPIAVYTDYTFTASTQAALTSPTPNSTLAGPSVAFNWSAAPGATNYIFRLGTTGPGSNDLFGSGPITTTSVTRTKLPTNGKTIYARLYTQYGSVAVYTDYTFTTTTAAAVTFPTPNTQLGGSTVTFNWSASPGATNYIFRLGTTGPGSNDLYGSGPITTTSVTRTKLPTNGETIYARLYTQYGSVVVYTDYVYTAAP